MEAVDNMIDARWLITSEHKNTVLENHALVIKNGIIKDILPTQQAITLYQTKNIEEYANHVILPGFINTHTHIAMNLFRGYADDLALMKWLNDFIWPAERRWVSHEFVYDASRLAIAEMIRSGTTCFNDMYFFLQATAEAVDQAGVRASIGITAIDFPTAWAKTIDEYLEKGLEFYAQYKNHARIRTTLAPQSIYTVAEPNLEKIKKIAEDNHLRINIHLHETQDEINQSLAQTKQRPIRRLQNIGLLTPDLIAVHMVHVNEEDLEILKATRPQIVHCPESNMKLASGACPVVTYQNLGLNVALGTDGAASNNDLDMITEMRSANFLAKLTTHNPAALPAIDTITMATLNGAKALGIDQMTGSLTKGKAADFIAIKLDEIETLPLYHPASQIVYAASRNQVSDVWVAGKQLMKNRELLTLNEEEIKAKAIEWEKKLLKKS